MHVNITPYAFNEFSPMLSHLCIKKPVWAMAILVISAKQNNLEVI